MRRADMTAAQFTICAAMTQNPGPDSVSWPSSLHLLALGVNHHTAPVDIRGKVAFAPEKLIDALAEVTAQGAAHEAAILSTCNRTELYCNLEPAHNERLVKWFCDYHRVNRETLHPFLYQYPDQVAVRHAFRV